MCYFEFFGILDFPRLILLINQYSKRYRFVVEGRIKKVTWISLRVRLKM